MVSLVVKVNGSESRHPINGVAVVGRDRTCDVVLDGDKLSSRQNTKIFTDGRRFLVEDLSSRNGTFLNGVRLKEVQALQDGDEIRVGNAVILFEDPTSAPAVPRVRRAPSSAPAISAADEAQRAFLSFFSLILTLLIFGTTAVLSKLLFTLMLKGS